MRSPAREDGASVVAAVRMVIAVILALVGLALTWRSEGDLTTLVGVLIAVAAMPVLPRPGRWRTLLSGAHVVVLSVVGLTLVAALIIVTAALLGYDGVSVATERYDAAD